MVTIYICTFNEELLLPYTIAFYRKRFPACKIVIIDNFSTDETVRIAKDNFCTVLYSFTNGKMRDEALRIIKNTIWQMAGTPWVIVADTDMWLDIDDHKLKAEESKGITMIGMDWIEMVGPKVGLELPPYKGVRIRTNQIMCFKRDEILSMNFDYGAHECLPIGRIKFSDTLYPMYHNKWLSLEYVIDRHKKFRNRFTKREKKMGLSVHYFFSRRKLTGIWNKLFKNSKPILIN